MVPGPFVVCVMRVSRTHALRFILALLASLGGLACAGAQTASSQAADDKQPTAIQFTLDRPIDAVAAPVVMAQAGGLFGAEGLSVNIGTTATSQDAIARVTSGASDLALVDINALMRHRDKEKPDSPHAKAVFMLFNRAAYAIIARKSRGIQTLAELDGKSLGLVEGDPAAKLWPAVAKQNGIKLSRIKQSDISAAVREPMLSAGQVDAVTGISYLTAINLRDRGVPADDLVLLKFADYGCEAYGLAIIVNPAFAATKPEAVRGFVRAVIGGLNMTVKEPALALGQVVERMDGGSRDIELERWRVMLRDNILTAEVRRNGLGGIDAGRFERSIDQVAEGFKFQKRPTAADIFDDSFLPPLNGRLIN
jgi:NitT/TauT family transport system substrate-binding protein